MVTPGKYNFTNCQEIQDAIRSRRVRELELERLMAQASQGAAGTVVGAMAYRTDYTQNRGEIDELVRTAEVKACTTQSEWTSVRTMY